MMKRYLAILILALLSGCATGLRIDRSFNAIGQDSRAQFLIIHYTVIDFPTSLKVLTQQQVSSHYLVRDDPVEIYQLVDDTRRAYHAGLSSWKGQGHMNAASIGIEIVNPGFTESPGGRIWYDYPPAQIDAVIALVKKIVKEHNIKPDRVLGHSDIAPQRKQDPGPRFPWKRLADEGLVIWPDAMRVAEQKFQYDNDLPDINWFQEKLERFGYAVPRNGALDEVTVNVIGAFQMKYRPANIDGMPDAETAAMLEVLTAPAAVAIDSAQNGAAAR